MNPLFSCLGKSMLALVGGMLLLVSGFVLLKNRPISPQEVYRTSLGEEPTADVKLLMGKSEPGMDDWSVYLRFQTSKETATRFVKQLKLAPKKEFSLTFRPHPSWQTPSPRAQWFEREDNREHSKEERSFDAENRVLVYDPDTQIAQFYFHGID